MAAGISINVKAGRNVRVSGVHQHIYNQLYNIFQIPPKQAEQIVAAIGDPEQHAKTIRKLERKIGANEAQMQAMLAAAGVRNVRPEQAAERLLAEILHLRDLKKAAQPLPGDSSVAEAKASAREAIEQGKLKRAARLLAVADEQLRAVKLVDERQPEQALKALQAGDRVMDELLAEDATDLRLHTQQGYLYKTYAQAFDALGNKGEADRYLDLANAAFRKVAGETPANKKTVEDLANAINGEGNILQQRGLLRDALSKYNLAVQLNPRYAYAWHDMLSVYFELAKLGETDVPAMELALTRVKETGKGWPNLDESYISRLESYVNYYKKKPG